jgi:hypothetical protein
MTPAALAQTSENALSFNSFRALPATPQYHSIRAYGPLMDSVYALRYKSYSTDNHIEKNPTERFMDEFDGRKNCTSYLTYYGNKLIGSIRLCVYRPDDGSTIPTLQMYPEEIARHIGLDKTLIEANRFVVHPDFQRKGGIEARFSIYRNIITETDKAQADCVLAAVREEHVRFYRLVNFVPISELKTYHCCKFKTILMACFDLDRTRDFVLTYTDKRSQAKDDNLFNNRRSRLHDRVACTV